MKKSRMIIITLIIVTVSTGLFSAGYFLRGCVSKKTEDEIKRYSFEEELKLLNMEYQNYPGDWVPIISVIANQEKYYGKNIIVKGYLRYEFEAHYLFLSKESADMVITSNAIPLYFETLPAEITEEDLEKLNGKYVALGGDFEYLGDEYGYGVIKNISYLSYLGNPKTGRTQYDVIMEMNETELSQ